MNAVRRIDDLVSALGEPKVVAAHEGVEVAFCCPFCPDHGKSPDTGYHLFLNVQKGLFICHRCSTRGPATRLFERAGVSMSVTRADWPTLMTRLRELGDSLPVDEDAPVEPIGYPPSLAIDRDSDAARYLEQRGFAKRHVDHYGLRIGRGQVRERIIIPTFDEEHEVLFWVARAYYLTTWGPKYLNPPGVLRKYHVFNALAARAFSDTVRICEGVLSAMAAGRSAVALFGKFMSREQEDLLVGLGFTEYVVSLDADAMSEAVQIAERLFPPRRPRDPRPVPRRA